jgi:hypothetical protein
MVSQSMIVFYGHPGDSPMQMAIAAAAEHNVDRVVVDQAFAADDDVVLDIGPAGVSGYLVVGGQHIDLDEISAVYARPLAPMVTGDSAGARRAEAWQHIITEWLDTARALVVNRPCAMASNASKPFQQQLIAEHFAVPDTLVTSCPQDVRDFWREHGAVVYKSTSGIRSIVHRLDEAGAQRLDRVALLPTQFQACVAGVAGGVHVVGAGVFFTAIPRSRVEYR